MTQMHVTVRAHHANLYKLQMHGSFLMHSKQAVEINESPLPYVPSDYDSVSPGRIDLTSNERETKKDIVQH